MKYDVDGIDGEPFPPGHGYVADYLGRSLSPVKSCDTRTGECVRYVVGKDRKWKTVGSGDSFGPALSRARYPAPLRLEPPPGLGAELPRAPYPDHPEVDV